jgi:hypothetical protein
VSEQCICIDSSMWYIVGRILHLHSLVGEISRFDTITKYDLGVLLSPWGGTDIEQWIFAHRG